MSGSTIGGVVGAVVGYFFGAPQLGWMIGSAIGGYVDPDVIKGPRMKDAQVQTTMEGAPRPIVYGRAPVAGNVIQMGPRVEHQNRDRTGKGGGPVQETYSYTRTFAVRVCEGPITGYGRVWRDDKLIADFRNPSLPEDGVDAASWAAQINNLASDTEAFAQRATFYLGDEAQLPDPTLEGITGVGNTPAYRGSAYVVIADEDVTQYGDRLPQYRFEVYAAGSTSTTTTTRYVAPDYSRFVNSSFPLANPDTDYDFVQAFGDRAATGGYGPVAGSTIADVQANVPTTAYPGWGSPTVYLGCMAGGSGAGPYTNAAVFMEGHGASTDLTNYKEAWLVYNWRTPTVVHDNLHLRGGDNSADVAPPSTGGMWHGDALGVVYRSYTSRDTSLYGFIYSMEGFCPLTICLHTKQLVPVDGPQAGETALPDLPGYVVDTAGNVRKLGGTATLVTGSFRTLALESVSGAIYTQRELGPVMPVGDANDTAAYWTAAYNAAVAAGTMPAGMTYNAAGTGGSTTYPRNKSSAYQLSVSYRDTVAGAPVMLSDVITDLCSRVGITTAQLDVAQVADVVVRGAVIGRQMACADALKSLQSGFFFDFPEWGNGGDNGTKLRAILRGGPAVMDIPDADLVWSDDDEDVRAQAVEFPRKINLISSDPTKNYEPTKQTAERRTDNIKAVGESTVELPLSQTGDERAQASEKMLKIAWAEAEGRTQFQLPENYTHLVPSDPFTKGGKRWRADKVEVQDGVVKVEAVRDRQSAYTSSAVGDATSVVIPPSSVKGPTVFVAFNAPSPDTRSGMWVAARGYLAGWPGCDVQLSYDGGETFTTVTRLTFPAILGTLTANAAVGATSLAVSTPRGMLDSVTDAQIAAGLNRAAVITSDVAEILQFKTATDTGTDAYTLTNLTHAELGTDDSGHASGDAFVYLDSTVVFVPINAEYEGQTLVWRPVTIGTASATNATYSTLFAPTEIIIDGGSA